MKNPPEKPSGIYLHYPFCKKRCLYCDFCSNLYGRELEEHYLTYLKKELRACPHHGIEVDSIFIGGGTPSLLSLSALEEILQELHRCFRIVENTEITLEGNPDSLCGKVAKFSSLGINRFSIGAQSLNDRELEALGRLHDVKKACAVFEELAMSSVNWNVDLMLGIPFQTMESLGSSLNLALKFSPHHISSYMLSVEEGSLWYENVCSGNISVGDEESTVDYYNFARAFLNSYGYEHYEISAFSKNGFQCRHNLKYWNGDSYLGFGPSASGFHALNRIENPCSLEDWCSCIDGEVSPEITVYTPESALLETIMLQFRLLKGISCSKIQVLNKEFKELKLESRILALCNRGLLRCSNGCYSLTEHGLLFANEIFQEFLD